MSLVRQRSVQQECPGAEHGVVRGVHTTTYGGRGRKIPEACPQQPRGTPIIGGSLGFTVQICCMSKRDDYYSLLLYS